MTPVHAELDELQDRPTIDDVLRAVGSDRWMTAAPTQLPAFSGMLLERHLGSSPPRTDLALRCTSLDRARDDGLRALCTRWSGPGADELVRFVTTWSAGQDLALRAIETLWFELDSVPVGGAALPALFFDLDIGAGAIDVLSRALAIFGRALSPNHHATLRTIHAYAPTLALYYGGVMLSRPDRPIRLCLTGLVAGQLAGFAAHLGLGSAAWDACARRYAATDTPVVVHVELDDDGRLRPTLGFEFKARTPDGWAGVLDKLVADGRCASAERDDVLGHASVTPIASAPLARALSRLLPHDATHLIRRINHVKLTATAHGEVRAKVYLYVCYY